ncbi:uncharacterized protein EURHEDRAFT_512595 [Aspergillus ruber CBS 135680]|uniref:Uncharacterized protein n=1 Tax=Aspergillus ruber (strain CBS 135680) TaxID=1388766 RepID=A0A017SMV8_ASPRC|nr:uncharacterized protein EURHEDRAFT_512595 [Aspergillus ruber CBS 135680]EYE98323.1 hypothetical protein EURHEDRAFT_512595 [Aspergillus ruber CBS 135680]
MECLGSPIDHRLRQLIRKDQPINTDEDSEHVRILQRFGKDLKIGQRDYLSTYDLSFGLELARPESKASVVVVLLQPHSTQDNSNGFLAGRDACSTIKAVSDLISAVTNSKLGLDDISNFEGPEGDNIIGQAQSVFADMIRAKQPNVVISCFRIMPSNSIVRNLRCRRLGYSFDFDPQGSKQLAESDLSLIRVNAFHPSYAINYHPEFSCFKRLFVLEFTKAFALWRNDWADVEWMRLLRYECIEQESEISKERWTTLLENLETGFEKFFFSVSGFSLVENTWYRLVDSKITWVCCDIALVLEQLSPRTYDPNLSLQLFRHFENWCRKACPRTKLQHSLSGSNGYYDHSELLLLRSQHQTARTNKLENRLYTFLRDLNLFAAAFENILEEAPEETPHKGHDLAEEMAPMSLNQ